MPQAGEIRRGSTESVQWDGSRWQPLAKDEGPSKRYQPGLGDDYASAFTNELGRTAKEAAIGLARSPLDLVKNTVGMVAHPITAVENAAHAVAHPIDTVQALGDDPRAAGSLLGQVLLGKVAPDALGSLAANGPSVVGRGMSAVGRGLENAGSAVLDRGGIPIGMTAAGTAAAGHPLAAAAEIGLPLAAKYGGKGLQAVGRSLEGLKRAAAPTKIADASSPTPFGPGLSPKGLTRNIETLTRDTGSPSDAEAVGQDLERLTDTAPTTEPASIRGLQQALTPDDVSLREDAVQRYLAKFPGLPTDEDVAASVAARNAGKKWRN